MKKCASVITLILLFGCFYQPVKAQYAMCPTGRITVPGGAAGWGPAPNHGWFNVAYHVNSVTGLTDNAKSQIREAFTEWNNATNTGICRVQFVESSAGQDGLPLGFTPTSKVRIRVLSAGSIDNPARFITTWDANGRPYNSEIQLNYFDSRYFITTAGPPAWYTQVKKAFLHEIGHSFALADQPADLSPEAGTLCGYQSPGHSVMNYFCGEGDHLDNLPLFPTYCDIQGALRGCPSGTPPPVGCTTITEIIEVWEGNCLYHYTYYQYWCDGVLLDQWETREFQYCEPG